MTSKLRVYTSAFIMAIDMVSLICMGVVVGKVYKIDQFKNKIIVSLILAIIMSLLCDFTDWFHVFINISTDPDYKETDTFRQINTTLDVAAAYFMTLALKLNLRIWVVHYLKIVFMGQVFANTEIMRTK